MFDYSTRRKVAFFATFFFTAILYVVYAVVFPTSALAVSSTEEAEEAHIFILPFNYMDAILIESDGHFGMVDSGESSDSPDGSDPRYPVRSGTTIGSGVESEVVSFLQEMGVNSSNFDFYIGTHPHSDHIGTAPQIISMFKPARIYTPVYDDAMVTNPSALWDNQYVYDRLVSTAEAAENEYGAVFVQRFDEAASVAPQDGSRVGNPHFKLGSAQIDIVNTNISDAFSTFSDANCISLGVKVTASGETAFLSGDINNFLGSEDVLASTLGHIDFLKLEHHGSPGSNTPEYLKAISPEFVFQTGQYSNLPSEVVDELIELGSYYYSSNDVVSDDRAAFEVTMNNSGIATSANYQKPRLYWENGSRDCYRMYRGGRPAILQGWVKTSDGWTFFNGETKSYNNHWVKDGVAWYWIGANGEMATGWVYINGNWYFFDANGVMKTGWNYIGSNWYLLNNSGAMISGWVQVGGDWYYLAQSGAMQMGWQQIGNIWYYLDSSGAMRTGWLFDGLNWYWLDGSGAMVTGWRMLNGTWYFFDNTGGMVTGWRQVDSAWYYFDESGAMQSARWVGKYYLLPNGMMA